MTDIMFTRTALTEAAKNAGITADQARTILEAAGVTVEPEKPPLPTDPGDVIIATEVRGVTGKWRMFRGAGGYWFSAGPIGTCYHHSPAHITAWTEARIVPVTAAPVTLTEDQVGEEWDQECGRYSTSLNWATFSDRWKRHIADTVNAVLAQHAAPAEGEPIDVKDVREDDRLRVVLENGDEATFTLTKVGVYGLCSHSNAYDFDTIRAVYLLHREEA